MKVYSRIKVAMSKSRIQNAFINFVLLIIISLIGFLFMEWSIRTLYPVYSPVGRIQYQCVDGTPVGETNSILRQWINSGEFDVKVSFNAYGLREAKDMRQSTDQDIFVVGDSFSYGQGVEEPERYSNLLDKYLSVKVFNISIPTNLDGYYNLISYSKSHGANITKLIVGVCMENDLAHYSHEIQKCAESPSLRVSDLLSLHPGLLHKVKVALTNHSAIYSLLTSFVHGNERLRSFFIDLGLMLKNDIFTGGLREYDEIAIRTSVERLTDIIAPYRSFVLIIPSRGLWQGNNKAIQRKIHDRFITLLREKDVNVLDLKTSFEATGNPLQFHYQKEGHWNIGGHQLAAKEILDYLTRTQLFVKDASGG